LTWPQRSPPTPTRRHQDVFVEGFQGTTPLDDPAFTDCLGYRGQIYEDRNGVYNLTIHTSGSMAGVTHVKGDVTANFTISPLQGIGVVYRGTHREHAAGNFLIINGEDIPHPAASFYLHGTVPAATAPRSRFTVRGHFVLDKHTGQVRRNTISTCRVS
jgi:hypothetical protein